MKSLINYLFLLSISFGIYSCKKFIDIPNPSDQVLKSDVFSSDQSATSAIAGIYNDVFADVTLGGQPAYLTSISGDELTYNNSDISIKEFFNNSIQPNNANNLNIWTSLYRGIYNANSAIEGLMASTGLTDSIKNRLLGEAKFIRAFCNLFLVNLWGDIPLILSTDYRINSILPREIKSNVYNQIISDLLSSQTLLSTSYITQFRTRPNKWATTALLARVYLFLGDYANAEAQSSLIINNGGYLMSSLANTFQIGSLETIWQIYPVRNTYTWIATSFIPLSATAIPNFTVSTSLLASLEVNDQRKNNWIKSQVVGGVTYYYPYKYKSNSGTSVLECLIAFRLAEQYLIRAEARAQLGNISNAQSDLNVIRSRAGLLATTASTQAALLTAIEKERFVEMFTEWGDRWLNLKRTNRADILLAPLKTPNWQSTDVLWPVPQSQIDANPFLIQNAGY